MNYRYDVTFLIVLKSKGFRYFSKSESLNFVSDMWNVHDFSLRVPWYVLTYELFTYKNYHFH